MLRTKPLSVSLSLCLLGCCDLLPLGVPHAAAAVDSIAHVADHTIVSQSDVCLTVCPSACMYLGCCVVLLQVFRTRQQLFKSITPDYYGFRDEEDGVLLAVEAEAEKALQAKVSDVVY